MLQLRECGLRSQWKVWLCLRVTNAEANSNYSSKWSAIVFQISVLSQLMLCLLSDNKLVSMIDSLDSGLWFRYLCFWNQYINRFGLTLVPKINTRNKKSIIVCWPDMEYHSYKWWAIIVKSYFLYSINTLPGISLTTIPSLVSHLMVGIGFPLAEQYSTAPVLIKMWAKSKTELVVSSSRGSKDSVKWLWLCSTGLDGK